MRSHEQSQRSDVGNLDLQKLLAYELDTCQRQLTQLDEP